MKFRTFIRFPFINQALGGTRAKSRLLIQNKGMATSTPSEGGFTFESVDALMRIATLEGSKPGWMQVLGQILGIGSLFSGAVVLAMKYFYEETNSKIDKLAANTREDINKLTKEVHTLAREVKKMRRPSAKFSAQHQSSTTSTVTQKAAVPVSIIEPSTPAPPKPSLS